MDMNKVAGEPETKPEVELQAPSEEEFNQQLEAGPSEDVISKAESAQKEAESETKENEPDYKSLYEAERKRRIESQKDALAKRAQLKQLESEKAAKLEVKEVSDADLKAKYDNWDDLTENEQKALRRAENAERRAEAAEAARTHYAEEDKLTQELDDFLDLAEAEGKFPDVREQVEEFKAFAREKQNRGRDLEELAKVWSFDHPKKSETKKPSTPFGNSGRQSPETKPKKMSWQQERDLRQSNPREYERMLEAGLLD